MTCLGFGVASLDFRRPKRPLISPARLSRRGGAGPGLALPVRSFIAMYHDGLCEPLRSDDVLARRRCESTSEVGVRGYDLLERLLSGVVDGASERDFWRSLLLEFGDGGGTNGAIFD